MSSRAEIVVTGLGVVSPIGVGVEAFWRAVQERRSGVGPITLVDPSRLPVSVAAEVRDFDPKVHVRPRKSLKIMSRDMQFGVAAAIQAWEGAKLEVGQVDPDRVGVVFGADTICSPAPLCHPAYAGCFDGDHFDMPRYVRQSYETTYPLQMLTRLPNLVPCHVSIAVDARGPNNTLHQGEVSSLLAMAEAMRVIERGAADIVLTGGSSSMFEGFDWSRWCVLDELSPAHGDQPLSPRPFDARRDGQVRGEGAAALVFERREHAEARGAEILALVLGTGAAAEPRASAPSGRGLVNAVKIALRDAGRGSGELQPKEIGHVNAHGLGTTEGDRVESQALSQVFNGVPVTAPKSYIGNLGAAGGAVEALVSVLALRGREVPVTLNHTATAPECPLNVVHDQPVAAGSSLALLVNQTSAGQAAALVLAGA